MNEASDFKKKILEDAPRMTPSDRFRFSCNPGVPCFNACCADINIVLTPYDILRLKNRLGITSGEFLDTYAVVPFNKEVKQPVPVMKMSDHEDKRCQFVGEQGCTVYEDRPWACRMYPLGLAAPRDEVTQGQRFFFLLEEEHCKGFEEQNEYSVAGWIEDQGIREYDEAGELFKAISLNPYFDSGDLSPAKMDMFFNASYDLDRFRRFVFESTFFEKFVVDEETVEQIRTDDFELMQFSFRFLRYALFYEPTMELTPEFEALKKREKQFFNKDKEDDNRH